jgi:protein TonB
LIVPLIVLAAAAPGAADVVENFVRIEMAVGAEGGVTGCTVVASDAPEPMRAAACRIMTEKARFKPALDTAGKPIASKVRQTIRFRIPPDELASEAVVKP